MRVKIGKLGVVLIACLATVLLLGVVAFLARDSIRTRINHHRAERLFTQAQTEFAKENWPEAARKGIAAYYLEPENDDIDLLVARALLKQRHPSAILWWERAINHPGLPVDELRTLTQALIGMHRLDEGLLFLNRLVEIDGKNPDTQQLWFQALQVQGRYSDSMSLAANLIDSGTQDWSIHRQYITMQEILSGDRGKALALDHLVKLVEARSPLALFAARELASRRDAPLEDRLMAARFLAENGETPMDRLYAVSVEVREGAVDAAALQPRIDAILENPSDQELADLARWSIWMDWSQWFVDTVDFKTFRDNGNEPDLYLRALLDAGQNQRLLNLAQEVGTAGGGDSPVFLYYRAVALDNLGDAKRAEETLNLATQVVDPAQSERLERFLVTDNRVDLLLKLYQGQYRQNPDNPQVLQKLVSVEYALGDQDSLEQLYKDLDTAAYAGSPAAQAFLLYLALMLGDTPAETHRQLETLLARYPETYDFRLVLGVSFLLQGQDDLARSFADNMPALGLNAPRYLRVSAIILGKPAESLLAVGELESLLPRERLLLSRAARPATR